MAREELQWLDEKKRDYIGSQGASGASTVEMKYKQEVEKKQKHRKSEQKSNPEVMPRPLLESGTPKTVLRKSTGETTAHIDSWLTSRVLAVPLVLLLTVIYIRLK
ncbi:hypothetical protein DQ04_00981150 [Trypanosoma grayi]|uniref:hypothetical protein n=1 Tax=Trypanosoma grayi TaxID=71804 RepID=UPI0004F44A9D|nr:hypothetical protein DQ04_00981150 [Trypanosoma grayi]KEG13485.1 hypothetical protein DQ04_00981150 [Trypanosoma grayi]